MSEDAQKLNNEETMDINENIPTSSKTLAEKEKTDLELAIELSLENENKSDLQFAIELSMQPFLPPKETELELATEPSMSQTSSFENKRKHKSIAIMSELQNTIHVIAEELQIVLNHEEIPEPQTELGYESTLNECSLATFETDLEDDNEFSSSINQASQVQGKFVVDSTSVAAAIQKAMQAVHKQKSVKKETASKIEENPMLNELLSSPIKERHSLPEMTPPNDLPRQTVIVSGGDLIKSKLYMSREEKECLSLFEKKYETLEKGFSLLTELESYDFSHVDSNSELSEEADEVQERELERFVIDHITGVFSEKFDYLPTSENYISDRRNIAWTNFLNEQEKSSNLSTKSSKTDHRYYTTQEAEAEIQTGATKSRNPLEPSWAPEMKFIVTPQEQSMLHNYYNFTMTELQERYETVRNAIKESREEIKFIEETIDILSSNPESLVSQDEKEFESSIPSSFDKIIDSSQISCLKEKIPQQRDFNSSIENEAEVNNNEIAHEDIPTSTECTNSNLEDAWKQRETKKTPTVSNTLLFDSSQKRKDGIKNSAGVNFLNFEYKNYEQNIADTSNFRTVPVMKQSNEYKEFIAPESSYNASLRNDKAEKLFRALLKEDNSDKEDSSNDDEDPESDNHEKHDSEPDGDDTGRDGKGQGHAGDGHGKDGRGQGHAGDGHGKDGRGQGHAGDSLGRDGRGQRHAGDGHGKDVRGQEHAGDCLGKDGGGQRQAGEGNKKDSKIKRLASNCNERDGKGQRTSGNSHGKNGNWHNTTNNERDEINLRDIYDNENGHYDDCYKNDSNNNGPDNKLKLFKNKLKVLTDVNCVSNFNYLKVFSKNFLSGDCLKCMLPKINIFNNQYADKNTDIPEQNMVNCYALNLNNDSCQVFSINKQREGTCKQNTVFENVSRKNKLNKICSKLNIKSLKYNYNSKTALNTLKLALETSFAFATTFFIIISVIIFIIWKKLRQVLSC